MTAASFYTLAEWLAFGGVCIFLGIQGKRYLDWREEMQEKRNRRLRRRIRDNIKPKPWVQPPDSREPQRWQP